MKVVVKVWGVRVRVLRGVGIAVVVVIVVRGEAEVALMVLVEVVVAVMVVVGEVWEKVRRADERTDRAFMVPDVEEGEEGIAREKDGDAVVETDDAGVKAERLVGCGVGWSSVTDVTIVTVVEKVAVLDGSETGTKTVSSVADNTTPALLVSQNIAAVYGGLTRSLCREG